MKGSSTGLALVGLDDAAARDPAVAGRKAANLARLAAAGLPVPPGVVLTTGGCQRILEACGLGPDPSAEEVAACAVPEDLRGHLERALAFFGEAALAVRSSGLTEDLGGASYAGQYETVLGVRGADAVADAVRRCLASAFSDRVAADRAATGETSMAPMAVLVQRLVPADAAGVAFTVNPVTGDRDEVHVSAVRGLAERLLSGATDAEEWVVRDDGPPEGGGPMIPPPWPVVRAAESEIAGPVRVRSAIEPVLDAATVARIADLGRRVERECGAPQDIEWALEAGRLWLLQARPITALPMPPDGSILAGHAWWNDAEHHSEPLSAFGAAIGIAAENRAMEHAFRTFGILRAASGYVAVGGLPFGRRIMPPGLPPIEDGPAYAEALAACPAVAERAAIAGDALAGGLPEQLVDRWHGEWRDALEREARALLAVDLAGLDDEALLGQLDASLDLYRRGIDAHFMTWLPYHFALHELDLACRELLGWESGESLGLVVGSSDATIEPTRALAELAGRIAGSPGASEALETAGDSPLERLREADPGVGAAIDSYLERFGARPTSGGDPRHPTLAERPDLLVGLLRGLLARARQAGPPDVPGAAAPEARALSALAGRSDADRHRFARVLAFARRAYPTRDGTILWGDELPVGAIRRVALEAGPRLAERGAIAHPDDVFHLEPVELRGLLRGERSDGRAIAARRRAERAWVLAHPAPAEIGELPGPAYHTEALPEPLRRIHAAFEWRWEMEARPAPAPSDPSRMLAGIPGSPGRHTGPVRLVRDDRDFGRVGPGDVIVCATTAPAWAPLFGTAGALVTDAGDVLAHPAIVAREHGIPAVLATRVATRRLSEGSLVTVDGTAGLVTIETE